MILDIDPTMFLPQPQDIVRFTNGRHDWRVTHVIPYTNTVYVRSVVGNRSAAASITSILTIKRDTKNRFKDYTTEYIQGAWSKEEV